MPSAASSEGSVTAEYAVGVVAAVGFAAALIRIGTDGWLAEVLWNLVRAALRPGVLREQAGGWIDGWIDAW
jgi:hypothetical protein